MSTRRHQCNLVCVLSGLKFSIVKSQMISSYIVDTYLFVFLWKCFSYFLSLFCYFYTKCIIVTLYLILSRKLHQIVPCSYALPDMLNKFIVIFMLLAYKPKLLKILNICMIIDEWHAFYIVSLCKRIKDKGSNNPLGTAKKTSNQSIITRFLGSNWEW